MKVSLPEMAGRVDREAMKKRMNPTDPTVASVYLAFFSFVASLWGHDWSAFLTGMFAFRMLASVQLAVFVQKNNSVEGISARSIALYGCSHAFRLSSTLWLAGYLPSDSIADNYLCQIMDIVSLVCCGFVVYQCFYGKAKATFMHEKDTMRFDASFALCAILAIAFHGDLDDKPLFDTAFFIGVYCNCFALAPQLWLMRKDGFSKQYLSWNYILPLVGCCITSVLFWSFAYLELVPFECPDCTNWVGYTTFGAHIVHGVLVAGLALRNAALEFYVDWQDNAFSLHLKIPTLPAPSGPALQVAV